jgi:hypothetical protein
MTSKFVVLCLLQGIKAATFSSDMSTMPCFGATKEGDTSNYNGQYCLNGNSWTAGQCCDFSVAVPADGNCAAAPQSASSAYTTEKAFCGRKDTISNRFLREFLLPANTEWCPTTYEIIQVNEN